MLFGVQEDYIEKYQSLDTRLIKNKASTFFFEAKGDSMSPLIFHKDILVVDRSIENFHGKVCVFALAGELHCKRVLKKGGRLILRSENPKHKEVRISDEQEFHLFGVVTAMAREFK